MKSDINISHDYIIEHEGDSLLWEGNQ
jgi:hypothetical protein